MALFQIFKGLWSLPCWSKGPGKGVRCEAMMVLYLLPELGQRRSKGMASGAL